MISIIILVILLLLVLFCLPSKEKFNNQLLYPGIHQYHKDSYQYGLHGQKKQGRLFFGKFSDYIPIINHIVLS